MNIEISDSDWEENLRKKLDSELKDGYYKLPFVNGFRYTDKKGKIDFEVELEREFRRLAKEN